MRSFAAGFLCAVFAVLTLLGPAFAAEPEITPAPAFSATQLTVPPRDGWITNGGNTFNQRYSPLDQIDRANVARLRAEWHIKLGGSGNGAKYSGQGQPIVHNGVIYMSTGADDVFAIGVDGGAILWTYRADLDEENDAVCCGWTNRGVALGDGRIYIGQLDGKLVALDQRTGKVDWSVQVERWQDGYTITSAPLYYDGLVITGVAGADKGTRGRVKAFDAKTGKLKWTFYNIPGPGEFGHETWPADNDSWKYGGASVWQTPALDPDLGMIYYSTGNAGPDLNGAVRAGDNLFTSSIVAVDAKTGKYRWHFQQVHHDLWDYDSPNPVVLFDVMIDGKLRKGLVEVSKTGWAYILDRTTGKPLIGIEERPVAQEPRQHTAATQPYPRGDAIVPQVIDIVPEGYRLVNQGRIFTPYWDQDVITKPSAVGGVNWPPSSYDPASHLLYVCANDGISGFRGGVAVSGPTRGQSYRGGEFIHVDVATRGIFAALDVTTNRLVWRQQWNGGCYNGSVVTAGGLVFVGRNDGRLTALDNASGDKLWEFQTDASVNAPVSTFEYKGHQYVVVLAAGSYVFGRQHGDSVWMFSLDGKIGPLPPFTQTSANTASTPPRPTPGRTADLSHGKSIYAQVCQPCHGIDGQGGHGGGAALTVKLTITGIMTVASSGKNDMPSFKDTMSPDDLQDVASYIRQSLIVN